MDKDLKGHYAEEELENMVQLALLCTQSLPNARPKMSEVLKVLEGMEETGNVEGTESVTSTFEAGAFSFSRNCSVGREECSFSMEPIELSGPR